MAFLCYEWMDGDLGFCWILMVLGDSYRERERGLVPRVVWRGVVGSDFLLEHVIGDI
jgi:hypothetical protein